MPLWCNTTQEATTDTPSQVGTRDARENFMGRSLTYIMLEETGVSRENLPTKFTYNYWQAPLVKDQ